MYYENEESTGVKRIIEPTTEETSAEIIANYRVKKGLKHNIPSMLDLKHGYLTDKEKKILQFWMSLQ